jgi:hypothetical protein
MKPQSGSLAATTQLLGNLIGRIAVIASIVLAANFR